MPDENASIEQCQFCGKAILATAGPLGSLCDTCRPDVIAAYESLHDLIRDNSTRSFGVDEASELLHIDARTIHFLIEHGFVSLV